MKKRFIIGNWKMYIDTPNEAKKFFITLRRHTRRLRGLDIGIAVPTPLISILAPTLKNSPIRLGAQTVSSHTEGAHTGEVSARMLKTVGSSFVIIGHSERRATGESNVQIHDALTHAIAAGLTVVLCVGETVRDHNGEYFETVSDQLHSALAGFPRGASRKLIIGYEPVWAIGKTTTEAIAATDLQEMHIFIRKTLIGELGREAASAIPVLYGGSVDTDNAELLLEESGVAGLLVGRASADIQTFIGILSACRK